MTHLGVRLPRSATFLLKASYLTSLCLSFSFVNGNDNCTHFIGLWLELHELQFSR